MVKARQTQLTVLTNLLRGGNCSEVGLHINNLTFDAAVRNVVIVSWKLIRHNILWILCFFNKLFLSSRYDKKWRKKTQLKTYFSLKYFVINWCKIIFNKIWVKTYWFTSVWNTFYTFKLVAINSIIVISTYSAPSLNRHLLRSR